MPRVRKARASPSSTVFVVCVLWNAFRTSCSVTRCLRLRNLSVIVGPMRLPPERAAPWARGNPICFSRRSFCACPFRARIGRGVRGPPGAGSLAHRAARLLRQARREISHEKCDWLFTGMQFNHTTSARLRVAASMCCAAARRKGAAMRQVGFVGVSPPSVDHRAWVSSVELVQGNPGEDDREDQRGPQPAFRSSCAP